MLVSRAPMRFDRTSLQEDVQRSVAANPAPATASTAGVPASSTAPTIAPTRGGTPTLASAAIAQQRFNADGNIALRQLQLNNVAPTAGVPAVGMPAAGQPPSSVLGDLIGRGEGGYNSFNRGVAGDANGAEIDFSSLTLGEVMRRQSLSRSDPDYLFAVGKYQIVPGTMIETVNALGIDRNQPFTPELQEQMFADYLIDGKRPAINAYITGQSSDLKAAQLALAQEFASVADPNTGRSFYDGLANNSSSITADEAANALNQMRSQYAQNIAQGLSPQAAYDALRGTSSAPGDAGEPGDNGAPAKLSVGQRGPEVKALQDQLVQVGVMRSEDAATGPGIFGPRTEAAVQAFQRATGLSPSGTFDHATRRAMDAVIGGVGVDRNPNPDVTGALQDRLVDMGYLSEAAVASGRGVFGPQTEAALKAFQADNGVQQTGILGATTFQALRRAGVAGNWPVPGHFTVNAADKPGEGDGEFGTFRSGNRRHQGIDINAPVGSPVESFGAGEVVFAGSMRGYGTTVIVQHEDGLQTLYAHLRDINVRVGQQVTQDTQLGTIGRSGNVPSAGDSHIHFETREGANGTPLSGTPVDPRKYLQFPD